MAIENFEIYKIIQKSLFLNFENLMGFLYVKVLYKLLNSINLKSYDERGQVSVAKVLNKSLDS